LPSPAAKPPASPGRQAAPAARLIPGAQCNNGKALRKQPQSVTADGQLRVVERLHDWRTPPKQSVLQALAQAVLPRPSVTGQRSRLAACVAADFVVLLLTLTLISYLRVLLDPAVLRHPTFPISALGVFLLYGALTTLLGYSEGLYQREATRTPGEERLILGKAVFWATFLVGAAVALSEIHTASTPVLIASAPVAYFGMIGWRNWRRRITARRTRDGNAVRNVLIVGAGRLGREVAAHLEKNHVLGRVVRGFIDETLPIRDDIKGRVEDLARIARAEFIDEIILTDPRQRELAQKVVREAQRNRLDVKVVPDLLGFEPDSLAVESFGRVPVLTLHEEPIPALGLSLKRAADVLFATAGLIATVPVLTMIAFVIKLDSPGPVMYRAPRVGKKGKRFLCHKFRTMVTEADKLKECLRARNEREGACFKIADDPRVTRFGRLLRRYSLDELPQLWNVLKGEMSLVGPRPHPLDDFEHYHLEDLRRLDVTPGITGLWQITARRDPSFQRNMALDLEYIEQWSLWMDLRILYKTASEVLQGGGR